MKKWIQEDFIKKCTEVHNGKYDYSKVVFTGVANKIKIICPVHGEFEQVAAYHIAGHGCRKCAGTNPITTEEFIKRAKEKHGDRYDYSKVNYVDAQTKVCIICHEHGEFWQLPIQHMNGYGCPKCAGYCGSTEDFIAKARKIHGDKYDYSKVEYVNNTTLIKIICPKHGEFSQLPVKHTIGHGCPKCGVESRREKQFLTQEDFIAKARKIHGDKYDYSKVEYKSMRDKVCIICHEKDKYGNEHGEFWQYPFDHINEHACPKCGLLISKGEDDIYNYLLGYLDSSEIIRHDRNILNGKEIDIYIPKFKIGIEYNGLKWHSEEFGKDCKYHLNKTEEAYRAGIKLIQIFEDEFIYHKEIVLEKLKHLFKFNDNSEKVMARSTIVCEINKTAAKQFLDEFHIQGYGKCTKSYGCFYNNKLIGVMNFLKSHDGNSWELVRFATDYNYTCPGVGGKLFTHFVRENSPKIVKTFADRRWTIDSTDNLYTKLGFILDGVVKPDYRYVYIKSPNYRVHKANFRKRNVHKKYGLPMSMKEKEMTKTIGYEKIWDCGLYRYIWKNETNN